MLEGSSTDERIAEQVRSIASSHEKIIVLLDSCHTEEHVLREMEIYSPLVSAGSYLVVYDTLVEFEDDGTAHPCKIVSILVICDMVHK